MRFLFPGFLFALSAVAIPIIIHLFNFRKLKKVYFSNVRFLKTVEQQTSSRRNLKHRLILAARILALIFLVLAFARPYLPDKSSAGTFQNQVVSVFIDNSYSMETVNREGTLLDEARRRAKEIAAAYSLNDKFQLLTHDFEGRHQRLLSYEDFISEADEVTVSSSSKTLGQIIQRQQDMLSNQAGSRKSAYIISDFQKNLLSKTPLLADSSIDIRLVRLTSNALPNVSVDSVWFASPIHKPAETEKLVVRLKNNSDQKADNIPVKLTVNKQQKALASLSIAPRATQSDTLSFSGLNSGWQEGEIQITDFPVVFDDRFYFNFNVKKTLPVLIINGGETNKYLDAVYRSDPFFEVSNVTSGNVNYSELGQYPLIILNEVNDITAGLRQQLTAYIKRGGSLTVFPSLNADQSSLKTFLQGLNTDVPEEVVSQETKVASINTRHPVFEGVFDRIPKNLGLPVAKKYIRYSTQSKTNKQNLLELPGRRGFVSGYRLNSGKIYLSAVPLTDEAGNLPRHSVFVPLMYQVALLGMKDQRLFYTLNKDQLLAVPKIILPANQTLKLKKGSFETIPDVRQVENATQLFVADQVKEAGNYSLFRGDSLLSVLSFNASGLESDLSYAEKSELQLQFGQQKTEIFEPGGSSLQNAIKSVNEGVQLWKLCIILALLCLAAEILLIRFYKITILKTVAT